MVVALPVVVHHRLKVMMNKVIKEGCDPLLLYGHLCRYKNYAVQRTPQTLKIKLISAFFPVSISENNSEL